MCTLLNKVVNEFSIQVVANIIIKQLITAFTLPSETIRV